MPRVRRKLDAPGPPYNGNSGTWHPGDEKDVSDTEAAWLLGPMAEQFEAVGGDVPSTVPSEPALNGRKDRAFRGGKKK